MRRIFLSYSRKDSEMADDIRTALTSLEWTSQIELWKDDRSLSAGDEWEHKLWDSLESSDLVLACISRHYLASPWCRREAEEALDNDVLVLPCMLEPWDLASTPLARRQLAVRGKAFSDAWHDKTRRAKWLNELVQDVGRALDRSKRFARPPTEDRRDPAGAPGTATRPAIRTGPTSRRPGWRIAILVGGLVLAGGVGGLALGDWTTPGVSTPSLPSLRMIHVEGGDFIMGDSAGEPDEAPAHRVVVQDFWLSRNEITQRQFVEIMGEDPSAPDFGVGPRHPVQNVSWLQAVKFTNELSEREGLDACYDINSDSVSWSGGLDCEGYRLPTEAEWEYAARAGTVGPWSWGDDPELAKQYAVYAENSGGEARPVGREKPNPWGFHDLHGNVREWVWDAWAPDDYARIELGQREVVDRAPVLLFDRGPRVLRGGSFASAPGELRSSDRVDRWVIQRHHENGFRVARTSTSTD